MIGSFNAQSLSFLLQYNIGEVTNINILEEKMFSGRGRILSEEEGMRELLVLTPCIPNGSLV